MNASQTAVAVPSGRPQRSRPVKHRPQARRPEAIEPPDDVQHFLIDGSRAAAVTGTGRRHKRPLRLIQLAVGDREDRLSEPRFNASAITRTHLVEKAVYGEDRETALDLIGGEVSEAIAPLAVSSH